MENKKISPQTYKHAIRAVAMIDYFKQHQKGKEDIPVIRIWRTYVCKVYPYEYQTFMQAIKREDEYRKIILDYKKQENGK